MHGEGHDPGGEHIILHVRIPRRPCLFQKIELDVVLSDVVEVVEVGDGP